MNAQEFDTILSNRLIKIQDTLSSKAREYSDSSDRLYNFKRAGVINHTTPEKALWDMATKHLVSVIDLVEQNKETTIHMIDEKIGDLINYLILLEAILIEKTGTKNIAKIVKSLPEDF